MENEEKKKNNTEGLATEITIIDDKTIHDKIYEVRGRQVMLDFELAEIYGYETKNFNRQVKNNIEKFEGEDFMFRLTWEEMEELSRCKNFTLNRPDGRGSNFKYLPYAFTEQGVYMLMTVLRGELATRQSRALVKAFKAMKDYILQNQSLIDQHNYLRLSVQMTEMQKELSTVRQDLQNYGTLVLDHDQKLVEVMERLSDTVRKSELSPIMLDFSREEVRREYLFLDGQPMKADAAYISIYSRAKKSVHIVDDYLGAKTLHLLQDVQSGVVVTIFSDNKHNKLALSDYQDFQRQFPTIPVTFIRTQNKAHDRFIVLDYNTTDERVFHCGTSSKDAGIRMAAVTEFTDGTVKKTLHDAVTNMLGNPSLVLR